MNWSIEHIQLSLIEPQAHSQRNKNFIIAFTSDNKNICMAYNWAIESVLTREGLLPHHHSEEELAKQHAPGYHEWEIQEDSNKATLEQLLPEIEARAKETAEVFGHFGAEVE